MQVFSIAQIKVNLHVQKHKSHFHAYVRILASAPTDKAEKTKSEYTSVYFSRLSLNLASCGRRRRVSPLLFKSWRMKERAQLCPARENLIFYQYQCNKQKYK